MGAPSPVGVDGADDGNERDAALSVVDRLSSSYGWCRRDVLYDTGWREALDLIEEIKAREDGRDRFQAALHDKSMADREGRFSGIRQGAMARMKARRGGGH